MGKRFGLLGETLSYSLSPRIHQALFEKLGIEATYELVEIPVSIFAGELTRAKLKRLDGFNVTTPYKELIIPLLDDIDFAAARIGAVNTVVNEKGSFKGYNTDYYGFMTSIGDLGIKRRHRAIVLGSGGAARMAVIALEDMGFEEIVIVSRNAMNAQTKFKKHLCMDYTAFNHESKESDLLVNCTPVGQKVIEVTEPIKNSVLKLQGAIFDLNYNPSVTPLIAQGLLLKVKGMNGLNMLVAQAVKAEAIWLQTQLPVDSLIKGIIADLFTE